MAETVRAGTSEYDRFGPWIDEVTEPDEVPPLFRDHPLDFAATRLVLKVPRNIARRDATPDMDLYDHVLALDDSGMTVLSRNVARGGRRSRVPVERGYQAKVVSYADVAAILDVVELLDGRLAVFTRDGATVSLSYNGAASANVTRFVTELRHASSVLPASAVGRSLLAAGRAEPRAIAPLDAGKADLILVHDFTQLARHNAELTPWSCHGRTAGVKARRDTVGAARRALYRLAPMTLHGAVVASDGAALEVVGRRDWLKRTRAEDHSRSRLVVPLGGLDGIEVSAHGRFEGVTEVGLRAGEARVAIAVPSDSAASRVFASARG